MHCQFCDRLCMMLVSHAAACHAVCVCSCCCGCAAMSAHSPAVQMLLSTTTHARRFVCCKVSSAVAGAALQRNAPQILTSQHHIVIALFRQCTGAGWDVGGGGQGPGPYRSTELCPGRGSGRAPGCYKQDVKHEPLCCLSAAHPSACTAMLCVVYAVCGQRCVLYQSARASWMSNISCCVVRVLYIHQLT